MEKDHSIKKIALIVGGLNSEHDVSLQTGKSFAKALDQLGYGYEVIEAKEDLPEQLFKHRPDVALLALHGKLAEDGTVQGICEYLKIPYSGSGVLSSALAMNKVMAKQIFSHNEIPTPRWEVVTAENKQNFESKLNYPIVVKPARDGSSVGLSIVYEKGKMTDALDLAFQYDKVLLLEEYIAGMEVTVPYFLGKTLSSIEIVPRDGFYDYQNKYTSGKTDYFLPARLSEEMLQQLSELTIRACQSLDVRTYARVDFRVRNESELFILEVNTLPGCTETSLVPKSAAKDGIQFPEFIHHLIKSARLDYEGVR